MNEHETKKVETITDRLLSMAPIRGEKHPRWKETQDPLDRLSIALDVLQGSLAGSLFDRAETRKFELAVENASDQIVITDRDGLILFANRALETVTGYSPQTAHGKNIDSKDLWLNHMPQSFFDEFWQRVKQEKKPYKRVFSNKRANGQEYISEMNVTPVLDSVLNLRYVVIIERDITEAKKLEQAKDTFLSVASHELQTPLTAIHWYVEMLKSQDFGALNHKQMEFVMTINQVTKQLSDLVKMLLNTSRIDVGSVAVKPEPVDIKAVIETVVKEIQGGIAEKNLALVQKYPAKIQKIPLDKNLIQVAFTNLLSNAVKYNKREGKISILVSALKNGYRIEVSDTGMGIPPSQQDRIFSRMFRADNARTSNIQGTGLGLYITKWVVESAGGTIGFTSVVDEGTTFVITLPFTGMAEKKGTKTLD